MKMSAYQLLKILAAGLVVLGLAGCETIMSPPTQAQNKADAANRWKQVRSGLILEMAQQQFDTGDLDQAQKNLNDAISMDPTNPRLYVLAGRIMLERGQLERAHKLLDAALELNPKLPEAHYVQGVIRQRWQRYEAALQSYDTAYELVPDNVSYLLARAEMLVALDRQADALALLTDKLNYFDQSAAIRVAMARIYQMRGQYDEAIDFFRRASQLQPDDAALQEELALAQLSGGHAQEAAEQFKRLARLPKNLGRRDLQWMLADSYTTAGRHEDAKEVLLRLTHSDRGDVGAWVRLAECAWALHDEVGALQAAQRAMQLAPRRPEGFLLAGMVYQSRDKTDDALRMFDRAAELAPKDVEAVLLRGLVLEQAGRKSAAAAAYADALRRAPQDQRARRLLAEVSH